MTEQLLSNSYHNFVRYIRNPITRTVYVGRLKRFLNYCQVKDYDSLLFGNDSRIIQSHVTDFLIHLQGLDLSSGTVANHRTGLKSFYEMNDVTNLNWRKISKVMSEHKKVANDRPYNRDEIARMLEKADQRSRIIILLMCSSGLREGAIHLLKLSHLEKLSEIYKITCYKNFREEYITFCSLECTKVIDDYLDFRQRFGEKLKSHSPLIREQFDKTDPVKCASPKEVGRRAIANIIWRLIVDSGVREKKNIVRGQKKILHDVMQSHGLRKFFNTQIIVNGIKPIMAEAMMGHRQGLAMDSYVKPTVAQMLDEYLKVVDSVTIDPSLRLQRENKSLREENREIQRALSKIDRLYDELGISK